MYANWVWNFFFSKLMGDKDALVNAINGSHDFRLGKFDQQVRISSFHEITHFFRGSN